MTQANQPALRLPPLATIGQPVSEVATPALLLDLDAFEANLVQMQNAADAAGVAMRPHAKAHKSVSVAQRQVAAGAAGICCQKLSEAFPFAAAGVASIHVSNEIAGAGKVGMAVELARHTRLSLCVDDPRQVAEIGAAAVQGGVHIDILPEVDVGQGRCGVATTDALLALIDAIADWPALRFSGIQGYHGGIQHVDGWVGRRDAARLAADTTAGYLRALDARGIRCRVVTGGGTGTAEFDMRSGVYTEIQPGSYLFMDAHYGSLAWEGALQFRQSLFIAATVMSAAHAGRLVCDVGLKSAAVDSGPPRVWEEDDADGALRYLSANDEHGVMALAHGDVQPWLGRPVRLVPGHCDPTVNLYDAYVCVRGGQVEAIWEIEARGLSR
jgi:D-serine deaminase-like pyridoxal phosphate-dependent protein